MKRKLSIVLLSLAVTLSMITPSFAALKSEANSTPPEGVQQKLTYLALGDSIASGCKNLNTTSNADDVNYRNFLYCKDGKKNVDVYAVPFSFVYRVAEKIGASSNSINGAYIGFRAKDVCNILGIPAYGQKAYNEKDYEDDWVTSFMRPTGTPYTPGVNDARETEDNTKYFSGLQNNYYQVNWDYLFDKEQKQMIRWKWKTDDEGEYVYDDDEKHKFTEEYKYDTTTTNNKQFYIDGINTADVITIELGENDISSFFLNNLDAIIDLFGVLEDIGTGTKAVKQIESGFEAFIQALGDMDSKAMKSAKNTIYAAINDLGTAGKSIKAKVDTILEATVSAVKADRYYFDELIKYIRKHNKDAVVVVGSVTNPFKGMDFADGPIMGMDLSAVAPVANVLNVGIDASVLLKNAFYKSKAVTKQHGINVRNYYFADYTQISLNPEKEAATDADVAKGYVDADMLAYWDCPEGELEKLNQEGTINDETFERLQLISHESLLERYGEGNIPAGYMMSFVDHTNNAGQQIICDAFVKQINKGLKEQGAKAKKKEVVKNVVKVAVEVTIYTTIFKTIGKFFKNLFN